MRISKIITVTKSFAETKVSIGVRYLRVILWLIKLCHRKKGPKNRLESTHLHTFGPKSFPLISLIIEWDSSGS